MKNEKKTLLLTTLICLIPMIVGALVYKRLPESMATHFGLDGTPNGWSSRPVAVFVLPGILLVVNLLMPFLLRADPKHGNMSSALKTVTIWAIPLISLVCSGATLGRGLGYDVRIEQILPAREENWNRTHRLAGFLWVICGLYFIVMSFIGWSFPAFLIPLFVMILVPTVYSYLLYRKGI